MRTLKAFFKRKETLIGIAAALAFQLIFFTVWLTAHDGLFDRTNQLKVTVVNDDATLGNTIVNMVLSNDHISAKTQSDLIQAKKDMDEYKSNMVLHIPDYFSENIQSGKSVNLDYYINQASPTLSKQIVENMAIQITEKVNNRSLEQMKQKLREKVSKNIASQAGGNPEVEKIANFTVQTYQNALPAKPVQMNLTKLNNVDGFAASMIPLLVVLASFVGAMILSIQMHSASMHLLETFGKWSIFSARFMINLTVSACLSIMTLLLIQIFDIHIQQGTFTAWWFQSLLFFSFLSITQMFLTVFGNAGILFNIITMATQLVSSGAMVPRELLSDFYAKIGSLLPATYGANGYFSLVFSGGNLSVDALILLLTTGILLLVTGVATLFKRQPEAMVENIHLSA